MPTVVEARICQVTAKELEHDQEPVCQPSEKSSSFLHTRPGGRETRGERRHQRQEKEGSESRAHSNAPAKFSHRRLA